MKADPFLQLRLLDVQQLDARLDLLRHRRDTLPQHAELRELKKTYDELDDRRLDARTNVTELTRNQQRADAEVEQVKARKVRDQERLDKGLVGNPKDLERIQGELVSLDRRIASLEDAELEVMEQLEEAQQELARLDEEITGVQERAATATARRDEDVVAIDKETDEITQERRQTVEGMPEDLMALYARLREQKGGVGAAALHRRRCNGCSLELNAADLATIAKAPSDEVLRCEECSRILVRTAESGL